MREVPKAQTNREFLRLGLAFLRKDTAAGYSI